MIVSTEEAIAMFFASLLLLGFLAAFLFMVFLKVSAKKSEIDVARAKKKKAKDALKAKRKRNYIDYFWSDKDRFLWISMFLIFFIFLGLSIHTYISIMFSIAVTALSVIFLFFAYQSYKNFPIKAKAELDKFENKIMEQVEKEVSFDGDNIQVFSNKDDEFDTKPQIFKFPTNVTKIPFPPFQMLPKKQAIIATRKHEFLVLSREYFSIGKNASMFDLLNPKPPKAGEFDEYYYSQMRNVQYDAKAQTINIIYRDHEDDVSFPCKKLNKDLKPAMKALKEKLRLNERQRMRKIEEHKHYEDIKARRMKDKEKKEEKESE
ncbi:hypothetical protein MNB_SV-14-1418 [hydrothermal vent metagenome]|uniref:Uncharacterized protein n=1 Tax=hydrothermal vent metagenome TaxID=652676 RepID=A0A1W1CG66_9ZZZZ